MVHYLRHQLEKKTTFITQNKRKNVKLVDKSRLYAKMLVSAFRLMSTSPQMEGG